MATKAKPKTKRNRVPRSKQPFLHESMEPPSIPALDDAASIYFDAMSERVVLSKEEDTAKDNLIDKMKEHGLDRYETKDGLIVTLTATSNIRCKKRKEKGDVDVNGEAG